MKNLSPEALNVLSSQLVFREHLVTISGQLDRKLYLEVNGALEALGGKWNRKEKAHIFDGSPEDAVDQVVCDGGFHDVKRDLDQFFTPRPVAQILFKGLDVAGSIVLEPSAGHGALAEEADRQGGDVVCIEKDSKCCEVLRQKGFDVKEEDFLKVRPPSKTECDFIAMNPPFSRQRDIDHVLHALKFLAPGGRLHAVMSKGITFRKDKKTIAFHEALRGRMTIEDLPEDSFEESGTSVRTVLVKVSNFPGG